MVCCLVKSAFSLFTGISLIPLNVLIHETGHYAASKFFCKGSNPQMIFQGFAWVDSKVVRGECAPDGLLSENITALTIFAAGPLVETIAVFATVKLLGGRNAAIGALPHVLHMVTDIAFPLMGSTQGDFVKIRQQGMPLFCILAATNLMAASSIIFQIFKNQFINKARVFRTMQSEEIEIIVESNEEIEKNK